MVGATVGVYTAYFGNPYMTALPAGRQISKGGGKLARVGKREHKSQILAAGK